MKLYYLVTHLITVSYSKETNPVTKKELEKQFRFYDSLQENYKGGYISSAKQTSSLPFSSLLNPLIMV